METSTLHGAVLHHHPGGARCEVPGGPIGDLQDPQSQLIVSTGVFGEFSVRVTDAQKFVVGLVGLRQSDNDEILAWFKQLFLRVIKEAVSELIVKKNWPLLQVTSGAYTEEILTDTLARAKPVIDSYGLTVVNLANFHVSVKDEDLDQLKRYARDTAMSKMAGGFQSYALGEAMMRGGGTAGGGNSGMDMVGMAMAQQMLKNMPDTPAPASAAPADPADGAKARLAKLQPEGSPERRADHAGGVRREAKGNPLFDMTNRLRACLFDLDGTLIDSIPLILACYRHTFRAHFNEVPPDDVWVSGIGTPLLAQLRAIVGDEVLARRMADTYREFQDEHHDELLKEFPGRPRGPDDIEGSRPSDRRGNEQDAARQRCGD